MLAQVIFAFRYKPHPKTPSYSVPLNAFAFWTSFGSDQYHHFSPLDNRDKFRTISSQGCSAILVGQSTMRGSTLPSQLLEPVYLPKNALTNTPAMTRSIANNTTISNALIFKTIPFQARAHPLTLKRPLSQFHLGLLSKFVESATSWGLSPLCQTAAAAKLPQL